MQQPPGVRPETLFIDALLDEVRRTERVLHYHSCAPPRVTDLCLNAHVTAMQRLCARQSIGAGGVEDLLKLAELVELGRRSKISESQALEGTTIAGRYSHWLNANFPIELGASCKWPTPERFTKKGDYPCEQCGKPATLHVTVHNEASIERHEFCNNCVPAEYR